MEPWWAAANPVGAEVVVAAAGAEGQVGPVA